MNTRSLIRPFLALALSVLMLAATTVGSYETASASSGSVLVYTGNGGLNEGYSKFSTATGKTLDVQAVLPDDLSSYDCVLLPVNSTTFSDATKTAFANYLNAGGRILAIAEWSAFSGSINTMNDLATHVGADLQVVSSAIDLGFHTTTNIDPSPFTAGVNQIRYAATSEVQVQVGPNAHSLVRSANTATTFIGVDKIGSGVFALFGDSNVLSDNSADGYTAHDNGVLAANLCDKASYVKDVEIDIKPGSYPNSINLKSKGVIPVAILTTPSFDASTVDPATVLFAGASPTHSALEDVDGDGDLDLILHVPTQSTNIQQGDTEACLTGQTFGGDSIQGCDSVNVVN